MVSCRRIAQCGSAGRVSAALLLSFLALTPASASTSNHESFAEDVVLQPGLVIPSQPKHPIPSEHEFTLRHIYHHGTYQHPRLHRKRDVIHKQSKVFLAAEDEHEATEIPSLKARSRGIEIERLVDRRPSVVDPMLAKNRRRGYPSLMDASAWTTDEVPSPDISDKDTILAMAYMAANAYVEEDSDSEWEDVGDKYGRNHDFGWQSDGLRGHIWADENNSTIVIGLKGTSMAIFDGDGTTTNDKVNDNLFFSCCCGQQGQWTWHKVCDCATGTYSCNNTCVTQALHEEHRYYAASRELYSNVTEIYPDATVWVTGHSLGGAVTSLLGLTYGLPTVTFEAPPEALAASRLGLPVPPGINANVPQTREKTAAFHFGHTADPVYIGTCNGATASCSFAGYAMESACHTGNECIYDVVGDKGWRVGIGTHRIRSVIKDVLLAYDEPAQCAFSPECRDCAQWKMYESNGTEPITTTTTSSVPTSTRTRTRTSTCQTPGWWGCLDETTSVPATTTTTTTTSTSTCETPGWFGCNDKTTTTTPVTSTEPVSSTPTTTCETPGRFWGCKDQPEPTTNSAQSPVTRPPMTTSMPTQTPSPSGDSPSSKTGECIHRNWLGFCKEWSGEEAGFSPDEI